jgi:hypothetical protein
LWKWEGFDYRFKPEPKLRPLNADEMRALVGQVISMHGSTQCVTECGAGSHVRTGHGFVTAAYLLNYATYRDTGKPVGVEVVE